MKKNLAMSMLSLLAIGASVTSQASAQRRRGLVDITPSSDRHGFWMNLGIGAGTESSKLATDDGYSSGLTKPAYSLRLGGTVNPNLRIGGEISGWADSHRELDGTKITSYLAGVMLIGQFYPSRKAGFFLKGGAGVSRVGEAVYGPGDLSEDGFGWTAGAGYEIKLSRSLFLTPTVDYLQHQSQVRTDGVLQPKLYDRLFTVGVALTIQPGR